MSKKTIAEQIAALQATRDAKAARMNEIVTKSIDEGRSTDQAEAEEFDTLKAEIKTIESDLERLRELEKLNLEKASPVAGGSPASATSARLGVQVKNTQKLERGIEFARYVMCKLASKGNPLLALQLAQNHYGDNERIVKTLGLEARGGKLGELLSVKATVAAGTTLDATWVGPLVDYETFAGDFIEFLRARTIIGQFGQGNVPALNQIPFNVRILGQTSGGSAYWVGEGAPKPLTKFDFNETELRWAKIATIAVLSNESIRFSNPSAERLVRDGLADAVVELADKDFINPAKAAVANVSPAAITNGATNFASSGTNADSVRKDLKALWAPFIAAKNPPRTAVYIMDSTTALALSLMRNDLGNREFPDITINGGLLEGVPVIVSDYVPRTSSGSLVVLVNARDVWLSDDGQVTVDASQEASLQMLDNPTNNGATGTATSLVSMFQTNSTAFRAERYINWQRRRASGVAYLTGVRWGE